LFAVAARLKACPDTNRDAVIFSYYISVDDDERFVAGGSIMAIRSECFVSGYGFSRIEKDQTTIGFSRWAPAPKGGSHLFAVAARLRACPDTNRDAVIFQISFRSDFISVDDDEGFVSGRGSIMAIHSGCSVSGYGFSLSIMS
jgi:hypothetical protein